MSESYAERFRRWGVEVLLGKFPDLRIIPSNDDALKLGGSLQFRVVGPTGKTMEDSYSVEMRIPPEFSHRTPTVREMNDRIPESYHKLKDGSLCLAAPTELRLKLGSSATLLQFVQWFVVPYLYSYSVFEGIGRSPYGELEHGSEGLRQYFADLFGVADRGVAMEFVRLTALGKKAANKELCPCGSGRRLVSCHQDRVNALRGKLGWRWFAAEYEALRKLGPEEPRRNLSRAFSPHPRPRRLKIKLARRRNVVVGGERSPGKSMPADR